MTDLQNLPAPWVLCMWRVGSKVGRTIYAMSAAGPSDNDRLIGVMDTPELAQAAVKAHNNLLGRSLP